MNITTNGARLTKLECVALMAHACKDECRDHIFSVHFDPEQVSAVATDGHRLAVLRAEAQADSPAWTKRTVRLPAIQKARTLAKRGSDEIVFDFIAGTVTVVDRGGTVVVAIPLEYSSSEFPPYLTIMPKEISAASAQVAFALNAKYMADLELAQKAVGDRGVGIVCFAPNKPLDPVLFKTSPGNWTVLVMPFRVESKFFKDVETAVAKRNELLVKAEQLAKLEDELRVTLKAATQRMAELNLATAAE